MLTTTTTCLSRFYLHCKPHYIPAVTACAHSTYDSGVFSTIFLYMVDVEKSRVECEEFVKAEAKRKAFDDGSSHEKGSV